MPPSLPRQSADEAFCELAFELPGVVERVEAAVGTVCVCRAVEIVRIGGGLLWPVEVAAAVDVVGP